ncbi:sigma 54-interacting transcriptional regulator [Thermoanaerobacterium saccharolyticum]|uniref:sigma 54-interacting transcriptional regulator n=1 Tax=Thermoanaerobacterium saccharolyticum TaxID=28896 RepID=UPI0005EDDF7E
MTQNTAMPYEDRQKFIQMHLDEPLKEKCRVQKAGDILGQDEAVLKILNNLRSPNPKSMVLTGPGGLWKRDILRACFKEVKNSEVSFFKSGEFVEYCPDRKSSDVFISNSLFGCVYETVFGFYKVKKIKIGLATRANNGILYINNAENLTSGNILKLLDVIKSKKVHYEDSLILYAPDHVKRFLKEGLPADFCLAIDVDDAKFVPDELLDLCEIIQFKEYDKKVLADIIKNAADKGMFHVDDEVCIKIADAAKNGEDAVGMLQHLAIEVLKHGKDEITADDLKSVIL